MIVTGIILRRILRSRRTIALALLPLLGLVVGGLLVWKSQSPTEAYAGFTRGMVLPVLVALVSFVVGASAVTDEREDLTVLYLAQTPVSRLRIAAETWLAACAATAIIASPVIAISVALGMKAEIGTAALIDLLVASGLSIAAYTAVAALLGWVTRRAVLIGLAYVLLWEGSVASWAQAAENLSVGAYARAILAAHLNPFAAQRVGPPDTGTMAAIIILAAVVVVSVFAGSRRLATMNLP